MKKCKILNNGNISLHHGDCLAVMDSLIEKGIKVDAVITDVPFGTTSCSWDAIIPFDAMWDRLNKITNPNTPILLHGAEPFSSYLRISNIKNYKYDWVWDKVSSTNFFNANKQPLRSHEFIHVFYRKQPTYNPQETKGHKLKETKRKIDDSSDIYGVSVKETSYSSTERFPRSIQVISKDTQKGSYHQTQKPIELMEYLIKTYTNKGDLVLDFTMGSGSTIVACVNTGRKAIGIDNGCCDKKKSKYYGERWQTVAEYRVSLALSELNRKSSNHQINR